MRILVSTAVICLSLIGAAAATDAQAAIRRPTNIPEQPLDAALQLLAKERDLQMIYPYGVVGERHTRGAHGELTVSETLDQLLAGTGLHYHYVDDSTITITPRPTTLSAAPERAKGEESRNIDTDAEGKAEMSFWERFLLAQADQGASAEAAPVVKAESDASRQNENNQPSQLQEVVVTGSRLNEKAAHLFVDHYSADDIAKSGQATLGGFLKELPQVSVQVPASVRGGTYGETQSIQLRGLPVGTTLVLIDGQRVDNSALAGSSFDLNTIPLALIERIDILATGSSAIYGSDAIAGVVNIVTKRRVDGVSLSASYGAASAYNQEVYSLSAGRDIGNLNLSIGASYETNGKLYGRDRDVTSNIDYSRYANVGGRDARTDYYCDPGTVYSKAGNLPGLTGSFAAIPPSLDGRLSIGDFAGAVGKRNLCSVSTADDVFLDGVEQFSGIVNLTGRLDNANINAGILYSRTRKDASTDYGFALNQRSIPSTNAFNPFGTDVLVSAAVPALRGDINTTTLYRPTLGFDGHISARWDWNIALSGSFDSARVFDLNGQGLRPTALSAALASSDSATALNPFAPAATPQTVLQSLYNYYDNEYRSSAGVANGFVRGPVFHLPAGDLRMVVGAEFERDTYSQYYTNALSGGDRNIAAAFGEAEIPLFNNTPIGDASINVAARYSHYSDFGTNLSPQYQLRFQPLHGLTVEATYGKAFRAPQLSQLFTKPATFQGLPVIDPLHGSVTVSVPALYGGNPRLRPETGTSKTVGINWDSEQMHDFHASVNYFEISEADRIVNPVSSSIRQGVVSNETLFPGRVIRGPSVNGVPGPIESLDLTFTNFGSLFVRGLDAEVKQPIPTAVGRFTVSANLTRLIKYDAAVSPGGPPVDVLGKASSADVWAPRLKGTTSLNWDHGPVSARITGRYVGRYRDYPGVNNLSRDIGNYWFLDGNVELTFGRILGHRGPDLHADLSGVNILDKAPTYSNFQSSLLGYDPYEDDLIGRLITLTVGARW